jgi:L-threonylcarbamoyladenylate synthase
VAEVAACVRSGGTVIFPTDTVYGIGCDPDNDAAIDAVFAAKERDARKPLALHVTGRDQAAAFVREWTQCALAATERFWPGPLAVIVARAQHRYAHAACGLPTVSLRCPRHDICQALLAATGPLAATSANRSGQPAFCGDETDLQALPAADLAVLSGPTPHRFESTIVDCTGAAPVVVREGVIAATAIAAVLGTRHVLP